MGHGQQTRRNHPVKKKFYIQNKDFLFFNDEK